ARLFRDLHHGDRAFLIPNPWDIGTARLLENLGFPALATTSSGYAFSVGRCDGGVPRDAMIAHVSAIASSVDVPVSADLMNGFGDAPEIAAETIFLASQAGAAGGSIEDASGRDSEPIYEKAFAADRVRAAAEAARRSEFVVTARAENYLNGRPDLKDTIERLQAYQEAGADVLYAPGLRSPEEIREVIRSVDRPVNVIAGFPGMTLGLAELSALGVKRVSVGSALARFALGAFLRAAREMQSQGTFQFADSAISSRELNAQFTSPSEMPVTRV
ncbi:MAG: isocitrate lyase/phosphoenolpyruvate mutase family protein, partial [Acidobacteriaceae bacterium]